MLILAGAFTIIHGLAAIQKSSYVADHELFSTLRGWGWFFLAWGSFRVVAGVGVFRRATWAILVGMGLAFVNCLGAALVGGDQSGLGGVGDGARRDRDLRAMVYGLGEE